jgi:hypothetical protein
VRPRLILNESVPGPSRPPWERFQRFFGIVVKVPKVEARKVTKGSGRGARKAGKEKSG